MRPILVVAAPARPIAAARAPALLSRIDKARPVLFVLVAARLRDAHRRSAFVVPGPALGVHGPVLR